MSTARIETETAETADFESAANRARRLWNGTAQGTAEALLREMFSTDYDEAIEVLLPWITDRVRATMRAAVREAEAGAWGEEQRRGRTATAIRTQSGRLPVLGNLEEMLGLPVIVPGKGYVLWRDMTVNDHRERIGQLTKTVDGTNRTIGRHEWSIAEITAHRGAKTLGDVPLKKLNKDLPA